MIVRNRATKLPWALFWVALGCCTLLIGWFAPDRVMDDVTVRPRLIFYGGWSIGFAALWYYFGAIDLSVWHKSTRWLRRAPDPPPEAAEPEAARTRASADDLEEWPTTLCAWCQALFAALVLVGYLVNFMMELCSALLD